MSSFLSRLFSKQRRTVLMRKDNSRVLLLVAGENASVDYFVKGHLCDLGREFVELDSLREHAPDIERHDCGTVVVVRYLPKKLVGPLRRFKQGGGRVVYFMDDDLMDRRAASSLPRPYAEKIRTLARDMRPVLEELCDEFWVSTAFLAEKYRVWLPVLLGPRPLLAQVQPREAVSICYHGSGSHQAEQRWLLDVITATNTQLDHSYFEIFGDLAVNRMYREVPRCAVLHPMSWPNYRAYTGLVKRDIALAPLLPDPFNNGRGPTKFFDFARMGAVGIYSDVAPFKGFVRHGIDGFLLDNDPAAWIHTIMELVSNPGLRRRMAAAAEARAIDHCIT